MLGSYLPLTYLFAVTIQYKSGEEVDLYSPTRYQWHFISSHYGHSVFVNTTSPLLNYTFVYPDSYEYHLVVFNAVSHWHAEDTFLGYYVIVVLYTVLLLSPYW